MWRDDDGSLTHIQLCNCGPARQKTLTALKRTLTTELRKLHFEVDVERVVPFFSTPSSMLSHARPTITNDSSST